MCNVKSNIFMNHKHMVCKINPDLEQNKGIGADLDKKLISLITNEHLRDERYFIKL